MNEPENEPVAEELITATIRIETWNHNGHVSHIQASAVLSTYPKLLWPCWMIDLAAVSFLNETGGQLRVPFRFFALPTIEALRLMHETLASCQKNPPTALLWATLLEKVGALVPILTEDGEPHDLAKLSAELLATSKQELFA